jgi:hypothetical protein
MSISDKRVTLQEIIHPLTRCIQCPYGLREGGVCGSDGKTVEFFNPLYNCPQGFWKSGTQVYMRVPQASGWEKVKSFWSAVSSGLCDQSTYEKRQRACFGNAETAPCPALAKGSDGYSYCNECGCGERMLARLDGVPSKLKWENLPCPRNRW